MWILVNAVINDYQGVDKKSRLGWLSDERVFFLNLDI